MKNYDIEDILRYALGDRSKAEEVKRTIVENLDEVLEDLVHTAQNEGYDNGYEEGRNEGYSRGKQEGHEEGQQDGVNLASSRIRDYGYPLNYHERERISRIAEGNY